MNIKKFNLKTKTHIELVAEDVISQHIMLSLPINIIDALSVIESDYMELSKSIAELSSTDKMIVTIHHNGTGFVIVARFDYKNNFRASKEVLCKFVYHSFDAAYSLFLNNALSLKSCNISITPKYPKGTTNKILASRGFKGKMHFVLRKAL